MTKFATLLDPRKLVVTDTTSNLAERAHAARLHFPVLLRQSHLDLWTPTMPVAVVQMRYLIGVAVSFSLLDLHFLDIVNSSIASRAPCSTKFDVFDLDDVDSKYSFRDYFPHTENIITSWDSHPIVGEWVNGELTEVQVGYPAINALLSFLGAHDTAEDLVRRVHSGDRQIFED